MCLKPLNQLIDRLENFFNRGFTLRLSQIQALSIDHVNLVVFD